MKLHNLLGVKFAIRELAERFMENSSKTALDQFVISRCHDKEIDEIELQKKINYFALKFKRLWKESNRKREVSSTATKPGSLKPSVNFSSRKAKEGDHENRSKLQVREQNFEKFTT